jgi:hypothetical protein
MRNDTRLFFALAYGWSWLFWMPAVLSGRAFDEPPVPLLIALGGIGPLHDQLCRRAACAHRAR